MTGHPAPRPDRRRPCPRTAAVVGLACALLAGGAGVGYAATLGATTGRLAAGTTTVASCGALAGAVTTYTVQAGAVVALQVSGLPASCNGGRLSATLVSGTTDVGHGGPVVVSAGTAQLAALSASPAAGTVTAVQLSVAGP
jgi:hypothetical protein